MAISRRAALGILTSVVGALFLTRCGTPETSSIESRASSRRRRAMRSPYGGGWDPYNPYDPYGGGWDPYNPYDPYGGGWDPYNPYDPYGGGWNPYGGGWNPYNPYAVERKKAFRSRADGGSDRAIASVPQNRRGLALSVLERLTDVIA